MITPPCQAGRVRHNARSVSVSRDRGKRRKKKEARKREREKQKKEKKTVGLSAWKKREVFCLRAGNEY